MNRGGVENELYGNIHTRKKSVLPTKLTKLSHESTSMHISALYIVQLKQKEERVAALEAQIMPRPMSRERLPPMEGFQNLPQDEPEKILAIR